MELEKTYAQVRQETEERNGNHYPAKVLAELDSRANYNRSKTRWMPHLRSVNEAHVVMLCEQGILPGEDASIILKTIEGLDYEGYQNTEYSGEFEDMYFQQEAEIIKKSNGVGASMHVARSRNDMCMTWSHLGVRDYLLSAVTHLIALQNTVRLFAGEYKDTLYVIHTHTQHAQPGIFGHYFLGFLDVIDRCIKRFKYAYEQTNVSPMGAAAVTTTAFPISRERVCELLGFDALIENSFDCIGNSDYYFTAASAVSLCALDLGRTVTDMVLWATEEEKMIILSDGYSSTSSIMPQKRNPIALEHLRSSLSVTKGLADAVLTGFLKSPYGDIADYEDIDDTLYDACVHLERNVDVLNAVIATMDVNKELLEKRAFESFSVVTEIADEMYRSYQIPFRKAHGFVSFMVRKARSCDYNLKYMNRDFYAETWQEYFGEPFELDFTPMKECIDPRRFVTVREIIGGTGPKAMEDQLVSAREKVDRNKEWYEQVTGKLEESANKRMAAVHSIITG